MMIRLLVAMLIATVLVVTGAALAVGWFYDVDREGEATYEMMNQVGLTSLDEHPELQERRTTEFLDSPPEEPERPDLDDERQVEGFVQVEFTILPDGSVEDVEVLGAQPSGVYEEQARQQVESGDFAHLADPQEPDGYRHTEIIDFSVPASEVSERD